MTVSSFNPPHRMLMGPGPSDIHPRVLQALGRPVIGHMDPEFVIMMDEVKVLLHYAFQTNNELTLPVSAPGSAGMETCFVNLVEPGDEVIVCINGVFGGRMVENVERCGATAIKVEDDWGTAISLDKLEDAIKANPGAKAVAFVHAETSTGALSDAAAISKMARDAGMLTIMDAVTSLGGTPVLTLSHSPLTTSATSCAAAKRSSKMHETVAGAGGSPGGTSIRESTRLSRSRVFRGPCSTSDRVSS